MICPTCNASNREDAKFCKSCGYAFRTGAVHAADGQAAAQPQAGEASPEPTVVAIPEQAPSATQAEDTDDPSLAPTLIITPEQMMAYHSRRWQQEMKQEQASIHTATAENEATSDSADMPTLLSTPAPVQAPVENNNEQVEDIPTELMSPVSSADEAIPIPPPPPSADQMPSTVQAANTASDTTESAGGSAPALEEATSEMTQTSPDQPNSAQPTGDFAPLAVGTTVAGRYEVTQVGSTSEHVNIYQVTDHQGYQRCWNCGSEQNAQGDEFCISCGAGLLNASYTMHEYSTTANTAEDANVLHGTIVNTFVDQGRTYVIVQQQAEQNAFPDGVHLEAASLSDAGDVRRSEPNEDSTLVLLLQRIHESIAEPIGVFIVADGLGGHDNGQVASRTTIAIIAERMVRELLAGPLTAEKEGAPAKTFDEDALVALLKGTIEDANTVLCQVNERDKTDMGSTITGFMVVGDHAYVINVGDSRTYMQRGGQLYKLTNDHSLVEQLVASGLIEPDEVYTHPQRSQIYRSLGDKPNVQIDTFKQELHPGDIILSCSDGLWEMVRNPQIESILNTVSDAQTACTQLIEAANANGGEDNVSAVLVFVR